ncbi:MAG: TRAP transporter small permease [Defluviitaleaceae bacterium]|nr:TRAP transporter small permease [Defluviitaleaceae bacterium]
MTKAYSAYAKLIDKLCKVIDFVCSFLMLAMVVVVFYQVVMRQIFQNPPAWSEEVSLIMKCWFVYLGIALGIKEDLHIGITMLVSRLPKKLMYAVEIFVSLLILGLSGLFFHYGTALATFVRANSLPATGISVSAFYFPVAASGILMVLIMLLKLAGQIANRKEIIANDH